MQGSFWNSYFSLSTLLYTTDETIRAYYQNVQTVGAHDRQMQMIKAGGGALATLAKAEKWLYVRKDVQENTLYIVQGHVFLDGNKRAGAAAMLTFLEANGVTIRISADVLAATMIDLQRRAEAGEGSSRRIVNLGAQLVAHRPTRKKRKRRSAS